MGSLSAQKASVDTYGEAIDAAHAGSGYGDEHGQLTPEFVSAAKRTGLFCMALPKTLGGMELDPLSIIDVLERLTYADGAAGWCGTIGQATIFFGWLEPTVASEFLVGAPNVCAATVFAPTGRAIPDGGGGFTIEGRWTFASGCLHSELIQLGLFVMDGDRPALRADGTPDWRFAYVHTSDVEVVNTWNPLGLRGTGSNDVVVRGLRVAAEHMGMPMLDRPKADDSYYQLGFWGHTAVVLAPVPLGLARRALDELEALLPTKPGKAGRLPLAEDPQVHSELGRARGALQAARAYVDDCAGAAWDRVCAGAPASEDDQRRLRLAMQNGMTASLDAVDTAYRYAGTAAIDSKSMLQRCLRDLYTARTHLGFGLEGYRLTGRAALGLA